MGQAHPTPPSVEEFRRFREPAGTLCVRIDIAGITVELEGLPDALREPLSRVYGPFLTPATGAGRPLRVRVLAAPVDYFIPPDFTRERQVYRMATALEHGVFRSVSYRLASWFDIARREGQIALGRGDLDPAPRALENFLRSAVAWLALDSGGLFLHAAGIVRNDEAYLFYGPSGAGKSTLAAMPHGGRVLSDDLTLILARPQGLVAAGSPFRGTYGAGETVVGAFPVAGFYRLRKDDRTLVRPDDGGCFADLLGNLPFVVDQLPRHPDILDRVRSLVAGHRLRYLHFSVNAEFWAAIDADRRS
jgi:hypothetical protein